MYRVMNNIFTTILYGIITGSLHADFLFARMVYLRPEKYIQ